MSKQPTWLLEHRRNVFSQTGEDGVIDKILEILPGCTGWCVEFGAWDGRYLSNVANLIVNKGYSAVLIEGDEKRYEALRVNYADTCRVIPMHAFVGMGATDNLDHLLLQTPIPADFDVLSIDIDGNDYHVWAAVRKFSPKVVCIEFNPTIPTEIVFIQAQDPRIKHGSSVAALVDLAKDKGYELIAVLPFNAIFVKREFFHLFDILDNAALRLRADTSYVTYIFSGYDGTVFIEGRKELPWHGFAFDSSQLQFLPKPLRCYPGDYGPWQGRLFNMYARWRARARTRAPAIRERKLEREEDVGFERARIGRGLAE